jgi:hypothetical protein
VQYIQSVSYPTLNNPIATSSVGGKSKNYIPKKRKETSTTSGNTAILKRRQGSKGRNTSTTHKRPPLKPNLKNSKATPIPAVTPKANPASLHRKESINTNPFKPPKAPLSKETKITMEESKVTMGSEMGDDEVDQSVNSQTTGPSMNGFEGSKATITSKYQ